MTFTATRALLVDELGVEPGPELQELQRAVLAHDPALNWKPAAGARARRSPGPRDDRAAHNLPWSPTTLIGRTEEVTALSELVADPDVRLITLVGPPGVGKTRMAVESARQALTHYPDGVWFVDLSGVADPDLVPTSVAAAAHVRTDGVESVTAMLASRWRESQVLVVMDNCEHLRATCAALVHELLAGCPGVSVLATSRQPLQVRGRAARCRSLH